MKGDIFITFRGVADVCVDWEVTDDEVLWEFYEPEDRARWPNVTDAEEQEISDQCWRAADDRRYDADNCL